jgi:hypothetical protein
MNAIKHGGIQTPGPFTTIISGNSLKKIGIVDKIDPKVVKILVKNDCPTFLLLSILTIFFPCTLDSDNESLFDIIYFQCTIFNDDSNGFIILIISEV